MSALGRHQTVHETAIAAPAEVVYGLIADAQRWPVHFTPTVHLERTELDDRTERLQIWATANDSVKSWTSRRVLDPDAFRVEFRQEVSAPPVAAMGGVWTVRPAGPSASTLVLTHDFEAVDGDSAAVAWITEATDRNSTAELARLKRTAEQADRLSELVFSFADSVRVRGEADLVYTFLRDAGRWPVRLPHVDRLEMREDVPGIQLMAMDTRAADGSVHTTESIRICFAPSRIVYKQLVTPALMTAHIGEWLVEPGEDEVLVTSRHTVCLNESAIATVLGPDATTGTAREFIRRAVGGNSAATLALAKKFAETAASIRAGRG